MSVEKYGWAIQLICMDLPRFYNFSQENSARIQKCLI